MPISEKSLFARFYCAYARKITQNAIFHFLALSAFFLSFLAQAAPFLVVNQKALDFGLVTAGASASNQTVTVRNMGSLPLNISSVSAPEAPFTLVATTCAGTLNANESCTATYGFEPTASIISTSLSKVTSNAGAPTIALRGAGRAATFPLSVSATDFDFGDVFVGTQSPAQRVLIRNVSSGSVNFTVAGGGAGLFGGASDCGGNPKTLAAGATCFLEYRFTPNALGPTTGNTSITVNYDTVSRNYAFAFKGVGVSPFRVSATKFLFGDVNVGTSSPGQRVLIENISTSSASFGLAGGGAGVFGGATDCGGNPKVLAAGASCYIEYSFRPDALGAKTGSTNFSLTTTTGNVSQNFAINFEGNGVFPLRMVPVTSLDFGDVVVGTTSAPQRVRVVNTSNASVSFTGAGGGGGAFGGSSDCGGSPKVLAAGASCFIEYQVTPTVVGETTGGTSYSTSISTGGTSVSLNQSFSFKVNGVANAAAQFPLTVAASSLDFRDVALGTTSTSQSVVVRNVSASAVNIGLAGGAAGVFGGSTSCGGSLASGATCNINYAFTPTALGEVTGNTSFTLSVSGGASRNFAVAFKGNGLFPLLLSPTRFDFSNVFVGQTSPGQRILVTNTTGTAINLAASGGAAGNFGGGTTCGGSPKVLAAGASCYFEYTLTPTVLGEITGSTGIGLTVNGVTRSFGSADLTFKGNGLFPLLLSPRKFDFGDIAVGSTATAQRINVFNVSNQSVNLTAGGGGTSGPFGGGTDCGGNPKVLLAGASCFFEYAFAPTTLGPVAGSTGIGLTVAGVNKNTGAGELTFKGSGTGFGPYLQVSASSLDFGRIAPNDTAAALSVTVRNSGNASLTGLSVGSPTSAQFLSGGSCPASLGAGGSCTLNYVYSSPASPTTNTATAAVNSAIGNTQISLRGSATASTVALDIDGSGSCDASVDPVLLLRYLSGYRGAELTAGLPIPSGVSRPTATEIEPYLADIAAFVDADEDGQALATTDALMFLRHVKSLTGSALTTGARAPRPDTTVKSDAEIKAMFDAACMANPR